MKVLNNDDISYQNSINIKLPDVFIYLPKTENCKPIEGIECEICKRKSSKSIDVRRIGVGYRQQVLIDFHRDGNGNICTECLARINTFDDQIIKSILNKVISEFCYGWKSSNSDTEVSSSIERKAQPFETEFQEQSRVFIENLRVIKETEGWKCKWLDRRLGKTNATAPWLRGVSRIGKPNMIKVCEVLGVKYEDMVSENFDYNKCRKNIK